MRANFFLRDVRGVSDVLGSSLLVGITVVAMAGLAFVVLGIPGPAEKVHAQLAVSLHPGADGTWGTGDEEIRIAHRGGGQLPRQDTVIHLIIGDTHTQLAGNDLGGPFATGFLSIGETYTAVANVPQDTRVLVDVIVRGGEDELVASGDLLAHALAGAVPLLTFARRVAVRPDARRERPARRSGPTLCLLHHDDSGVSNVVAAVLTFALIVMALVVVRVEFVPVWEEDREAEHMLAVQKEFLALKAEADRQAANRTGGAAVSTPVSLGDSGGFSFFTGAPLPGQLGFDPRAGAGGSLQTPRLLVFQQDGEDFFGVDEEWSEVPQQPTVDDVSRVQHLRIRVDEPGDLWGPPHNQEKGSVTLTVRDRDGAFAGEIRVYVMSHPSGYNIVTRVRDADMTVLYEQGHAHFSQSRPEFYWVNALSPENQFRKVLAAAEAPLSLTWTQVTLTGSYTISYLNQGGGQVGSSGLLETDWSLEHQAGTLLYTSGNRYFLEQRLHFENGAVFLEQADGATMLTPPHWEVSREADATRISFTTVGLTGARQDVSSMRSVSVQLIASGQTDITGSAPRFAWDQSTAFPGLWAAFWTERLQAAGLSAASGEYLIESGPDRATLTIFGTTADPASEQHDVLLQIRQANLRMVFAP